MEIDRPIPSAKLKEYATPKIDREKAEREANAKAEVKPVTPREKANKTLRLYKDHNRMLADIAHKETQRTRVRVTESDIIAQALDLWCETHGVDLREYE